jgi:DNA-binding Xre family transcriptional regulator
MNPNGRYTYEGPLKVSYNKLWKLLIDKNMKSSELGRNAVLASNTLSKMRKNETVSMDTLLKICEILDCDFSDIIEVIQ